jgi:hypothetical protein
MSDVIEASLAGCRIVTSLLLTERVQHSRSPSRARRRARQGHRQHYVTRPSRDVYLLSNGSLVMHPATYEVFKQMVPKKELT